MLSPLAFHVVLLACSITRSTSLICCCGSSTPRAPRGSTCQLLMSPRDTFNVKNCSCLFVMTCVPPQAGVPCQDCQCIFPNRRTGRVGELQMMIYGIDQVQKMGRCHSTFELHDPARIKLTHFRACRPVPFDSHDFLWMVKADGACGL